MKIKSNLAVVFGLCTGFLLTPHSSAAKEGQNTSHEIPKPAAKGQETAAKENKKPSFEDLYGEIKQLIASRDRAALFIAEYGTDEDIKTLDEEFDIDFSGQELTRVSSNSLPHQIIARAFDDLAIQNGIIKGFFDLHLSAFSVFCDSLFVGNNYVCMQVRLYEAKHAPWLLFTPSESGPLLEAPEQKPQAPAPFLKGLSIPPSGSQP